ncbi:hypothetical protein EEL51_07920 [Muribaculaceae bacterium Isolate-110 (HZI)]|nr:hypothetical protein EEL51_07920 [Muribaculaceae bacterium Isolate-110 (HZI)]
MSFWKGVLNVFGFGGDNDEDEEEYDSSLPTYAAQPRSVTTTAITKPAATPVSATHTRETETTEPETEPHDSSEDNAPATQQNVDNTAEPTVADPDLPGDLFDALIEQFNAAQPDFISKCLSTDAQRAYLLNSLSDSLKQRLNNTGLKIASANNQADDSAEHERLQRRISSLEADVKANDSLRQENRKLQLSIERQKRALLDRINDLEAQVAKSHAEKEKFFSDKRNPADAALIDSTNARVKELEQSLSERESKIKELTDTIEKLGTASEELSKTLAERDKQIADEASLREQLEVKNRMSDEMLNDLRNQAASARNEYEDTCRQQQLALEQIHDQVASFEQVKARLEARIIELKDALKDAKRNDREEQIARLNEENASLRHTIENNLYNQANSENRLRNEIKQLRRQLEEAGKAAATSSAAATYASTESRPRSMSAEPSAAAYPTETPPERPAPRRRGRPKKVKLDEDLDNTEWFSGQKDTPDFGYHEPPRRPSNDNAAQLSLF